MHVEVEFALVDVMVVRMVGCLDRKLAMMVVVDVMVVRLCDYDHRSKQIGGDGLTQEPTDCVACWLENEEQNEGMAKLELLIKNEEHAWRVGED
ncbi:hypothetical protein NC652_032444 [Populus alba x Populus x berolinensis]|nr:hypothetical protein NC652_032444 [Populus alba x Populus x berolinensis]